MNKKLSFLVLALAACLLTFSQAIDVQHYKFEIEVSDLSDAITGKATITVTYREDASQIAFDLVSVEDDKGMVAFQVMEAGKLMPSFHRNDKVTITLPAVARKGEVHTYEISYMGTPKDGLIISKNKFGDRTFFADNWPNRAHHWIPCIDEPIDKASFEFIVTAPAGYQVISNGVKAEEKETGAKIRTHWKEDIALPSKVMVIGVARFAIKQFTDSPPSLPISAWVYPNDSTKAFFDYGVAPRIVQYFADYIAPFPYKKLANVQSKTIFGGMENASAIFYAEDLVTGKRQSEDVIAHEIAHQWFGDMASEKSFAHLWLSEGFATYMTNLYFEKQHGRQSMIERLRKERREVISFARKSDHAVVDSTTDLMSLLNANSYQKGGWVLHMLRQEVGDSNFKKIIQTYYQKYKGGNAETRDFEAVAEQVTGKDLRWFFDQWLYRKGLPELEMDMKIEDDALKLKITQKKDLYRFPLEVAIVLKDGTLLTERIPIEGRETEFKMKTNGPVSVTFDPETKLLFWYKDLD